MTVVRLERGSDLNKPGGREQLQETLEVMGSSLRILQREIDPIINTPGGAERLVSPVPVEAWPLALGPVQTGSPHEIGTMIWHFADEIPENWLQLDGSSLLRATYPALFAKYGTGYGAVDGTHFTLPNLARRVIAGKGGAGTASLANTTGAIGGGETSTALLAHTHTGPSHTHDMTHTHSLSAHTHDIQHTHHYYGYAAGAGPSSTARVLGQVQLQASTINVAELTDTSAPTGSGAPVPDVTGAASTSNTGAAGTGATGSAGAGTSFDLLQPTIIGLPLVRAKKGPADTNQTFGMSWGAIAGVADVGLRADFPLVVVSKVYDTVDSIASEAFMQVVSGPAAVAGTQVISFSGLLRVPYNFRQFRTRGIKILTKLSITGAAVATSCTVQLQIKNPLNPSGYIAGDYVRIVAVSAGTIADSDYRYAQVSAADLGPDWKPGYLFEFVLSFTLPRTYTLATFKVGSLLIDW